MQALAEANVGEDYTIKWMFGVPEVLDLMAQYQIKKVWISTLYRSLSED